MICRWPMLPLWSIVVLVFSLTALQPYDVFAKSCQKSIRKFAAWSDLRGRKLLGFQSGVLSISGAVGLSSHPEASLSQDISVLDAMLERYRQYPVRMKVIDAALAIIDRRVEAFKSIAASSNQQEIVSVPTAISIYRDQVELPDTESVRVQRRLFNVAGELDQDKIVRNQLVKLKQRWSEQQAVDHLYLELASQMIPDNEESATQERRSRLLNIKAEADSLMSEDVYRPPTEILTRFRNIFLWESATHRGLWRRTVATTERGLSALWNKLQHAHVKIESIMIPSRTYTTLVAFLAIVATAVTLTTQKSSYIHETYIMSDDDRIALRHQREREKIITFGRNAPDLETFFTKLVREFATMTYPDESIHLALQFILGERASLEPDDSTSEAERRFYAPAKRLAESIIIAVIGNSEDQESGIAARLQLRDDNGSKLEELAKSDLNKVFRDAEARLKQAPKAKVD